MSDHERIINFFEQELERHSNHIIDEYAEIISKKYAIPLDMLLKDVPRRSSRVICRGTKTSGQRCTFYGTYDGYCKHHTLQGERLKTKHFNNSTEHTHGPDKMYVRGCPGCENSKGLIDLGSVLSNE